MQCLKLCGVFLVYSCAAVVRDGELGEIRAAAHAPLPAGPARAGGSLTWGLWGLCSLAFAVLGCGLPLVFSVQWVKRSGCCTSERQQPFHACCCSSAFNDGEGAFLSLLRVKPGPCCPCMGVSLHMCICGQGPRLSLPKATVCLRRFEPRSKRVTTAVCKCSCTQKCVAGTKTHKLESLVPGFLI